MKAIAPEKIYIQPSAIEQLPHQNIIYTKPLADNSIEYVRTDTFIEKTCEWIKENITNNPNANSVLVRSGCVTLTMLIEDFKKYIKGE